MSADRVTCRDHFLILTETLISLQQQLFILNLKTQFVQYFLSVFPLHRLFYFLFLFFLYILL